MSYIEKKMLIFKLNNERYATDISDVERIYGYEEPTAIPEAPNFIKGVITYQDRVLPIISLYEKFDFYDKNDSLDRKIIVVKRDGKGYGVIVDGVEEVKVIKTENIEEPPLIATGIGNRYIQGLCKDNGKIIIMLNLKNILTEDDEEFI